MINKKNLIRTFVSLGIFVVMSVILFYPQLQGKIYKAGDTLEYTAKSQEIHELREEAGREILWSDAIFSGMPSYFVSLRYQGNILKTVQDLFFTIFKRPIGYFLLGLIIMFFSLKALRINHWLATLGAIAAVWSANNFILFSAGHMSKVVTIFYLPLLLSGIIILFRKKYMLGGILFTLGAVMSILSNHPQMVYYFALATIPYLVYKMVEGIRAGQIVTLGKIYGILVLGLLLGVASNTSRIWTSLEYKEASTRGGSVLEQEAQTNTTEGLGWEYAMQWSNGANDLWASLIPGAVGGGSQEPVPHDTQLEDLLRQNNAPKKGSKYLGPLYWGDLPFTSGPIYFGAALILVLVFVFPFLSVGQRWLYGGATVMTLLLSLGKNAAWLNHFLFDYFPMFNNFRAPNSALSILPLFFAFGAATGLDQWRRQIKSRKTHSIPKGFWIRTGSVVGLCLLIALLGSSLFSFEGANAQNFAQQNVLDVIIEARQALLRQDAFRSFLMAVLAAIPLWAFYKNKLNVGYLSLALGVVFMFDSLPVSFRYFNMDNFVSSREYNQTFSPRPVDEQILSQEQDRADYRVLDYSINTFNSNMTSYYHNTIGGYHAVKMSRYQDLIDGFISKGNQHVLNMLNTQYIINQNGEVHQNPNANGAAWFIQKVNYVDSADEEYRQLENLNTETTAVINKNAFGDILQGKSEYSVGTVERTQKLPDDMIYQTSNAGEGLLVLSEVWYDGPGWKATIDGEEVPIIRANFALRAILLPPGDHTVELTFRPDSYIVGERISLGSTFLIVLLMGFYLVTTYRNRKNRGISAIENPAT